MLALLPFALLAFQEPDSARPRVTLEQRRAQAEARRTREDSTLRARLAAGEAARSDAFEHAGAAELVANARAQRQRAERQVTRYQATVRQRIGVGVRALSRDRMLFGQELVARIDWRRDGATRIEALGARQRVPVAVAGNHVPDLDNFDWLAFDPASDYLRLWGSESEGGFVHPLSPGAEAHYRYALGDTTSISLPGGRTVRVVELRVTPRRAEFRLMTGALWFDADSYGMVRAVFRPARPFEFNLDARDGSDDDVPGWVNPKAEVRYVTMEYGLYEQRWWLPRFWAVDAEGEMMGIRTPVRFERVYSDFRVEGGSEPVPGARAPAGAPIRRQGWAEGEDVPSDSLIEAVRQCVREEVERRQQAARERAREEGRVRVRVEVSSARRRCRGEIIGDEPWQVEVVIPGGDTAALLTSPELGDPILQMGDVITEAELQNLAREIGAIPQRPWQARFEVPSSVMSVLRHARYNRVEGFSLGLATRADFGRLQLDAFGRLGHGDLEPYGELSLTRPTSAATWRLGGYHRLAASNPEMEPFSLGASISGFVAGRDDGEYYRATGLELTGRPSLTRDAVWDVRIFAERQRSAAVETNASLPYLFDRDQLFRPNIAAEAGTQAGAVIRMRQAFALGTASSFSADAMLGGATGTFDYGRGSLAARLSFPFLGKLLGAEVAAGTTTGEVPVQSHFFLGGPPTLRGYDGGVMNGESFWRARGEVATSLPAARISLFSDAGWAGPRSAFGKQRSLVSVGIGASFLDGLIRLDLARGLRSPKGWRLDFYMDGIL